MIDDETKNKFLEELEKYGNVFRAASKMGISRSTIYRWCEENPEFRKWFNSKVRIGRENSTDIVENSLISLAAREDLNAIKFYLTHNSERYKPNRGISEAIIKHLKSDAVQPPEDKYETTMKRLGFDPKRF